MYKKYAIVGRNLGKKKKLFSGATTTGEKDEGKWLPRLPRRFEYEYHLTWTNGIVRMERGNKGGNFSVGGRSTRTISHILS